MTKTKQHDVIVIGAGPAGLCFARGLSALGLSVIMLEKQDRAVIDDPAYDGREIALTHGSHLILQELGVWQEIPADEVSLIRAAEVQNGDSPYALHFDANETDVPNLGFMVSNQSIRRAAARAVAKAKGVTLVTGCEVRGVKTDDLGAEVTLDDGRTLRAKLVVAADSRFSPARKMMDIDTEMHDLQRTCIVTTARVDKDHGQVARELFLYGHTLAVLPLNRGRVSLVVTCKADMAEKMLASPEKLGRELTEKTEGAYGRFEIDNRLYSYPLVTTYARRFYARRFALLGDAAVGMHPVTAHGFNLGLKGGHTLAAEIGAALRAGFEVGHSESLAAYDRKHQKACWPLYTGTNALVHLYTAESTPARLLRHGLLRLGNRLRPARDMIIRQLTDAE